LAPQHGDRTSAPWRGLEQTLELPSSQSEDGDLGSGKTSVHENQGEDVDSSNF